MADIQSEPRRQRCAPRSAGYWRPNVVALRSPKVRLSAIIPTMNRREMLACMLPVLLKEMGDGDEAIVVDNGSTDGTVGALSSRFPQVRWIELDRNISCAARNVGAAAAEGDVLVMMDDDSVPQAKTLSGIRSAFGNDAELGAISCRIRLMNRPDRHDVGGLAGVVVNCGSAIRREAFMSVGGYPVDATYYHEAYDLSCRLWLGGWRVEPRGDLSFLHARTPGNQDAQRVARILAQNDEAVWARYAPDCERHAADSRDRRRRRPLTQAQFEELFGLSKARERLQLQRDELGVRRVGIWGRGKGCEQLIGLLRELGLEPVAVYEQRREESRWDHCPVRDAAQAVDDNIDALIPGTLSPGTAADQAADLRASFPNVPTLRAIDWSTMRG